MREARVSIQLVSLASREGDLANATPVYQDGDVSIQLVSLASREMTSGEDFLTIFGATSFHSIGFPSE